MVELVDTGDLKSPDLNSRTGSSPVPGTFLLNKTNNTPNIAKIKAESLMTDFYAQLKKTSTEEDVKHAYIQFLELEEKVALGQVDIAVNTPQGQPLMWFEAKHHPTSFYVMFTQLLHYVNDARQKGEPVPAFLTVMDNEKAAILEVARVQSFINTQLAGLAWGKSASDVRYAAVEVIAPAIAPHVVPFYMEHYAVAFAEQIKSALLARKLHRTIINRYNLRRVFNNWVTAIGQEIKGALPEQYSLFFYADIMHDGIETVAEKLPAELIMKPSRTQEGGEPTFILYDKRYAVTNLRSYHEFWQVYEKPPLESERYDLLERRDSLIPLDERALRGDFYTPLKVVGLAYDTLATHLGENWQEEYVVWDMCSGVGNLGTQHSYGDNLYLSTLNEDDLAIMRTNRNAPRATSFQYDYLNDDIAEDGSIDYTITNKVPESLQRIIAEGTRKVLVLINPPYGEAGSAQGKKSKAEISHTKVKNRLMKQEWGASTNELFAQIVARILTELPGATLAMFSKTKYINAPNFEKFRTHFSPAYLGGFVVHSASFDGLKGDFPIGFLIWDLAQKEPINEVTCAAYDKNAESMGLKTFINTPNKLLLNKWVKRHLGNPKLPVVPLSNTITVYTGTKALAKWHQGAIGYLKVNSNDTYHASRETYLLSSTAGHGHGFYVTPTNLAQAATVFAVRQLTRHTWLNDRDQFLAPTVPLTPEFELDCLIYMLFHGMNLSAGADGLLYNNQEWSLTNHFIPFTEDQLNVPAGQRFESRFMLDYLKGKVLSSEAQAVLDTTLIVWRSYFSLALSRTTTEEFKLGRADVGWYQVRSALEKEMGKNSTKHHVHAYAALAAKLRPQIYDFGFLPT